MRTQLALAAALGLCAVTLGPLSASANDLGCGRCGPVYNAPGQIYYAPPTYSYAAPTITIVPHVIVQPNYIVRRTYVARPTEYVQEAPVPCWLFCGQDFRIVNQGQYPGPEFAPYRNYESDDSVNGYRLSTYGGGSEISRPYYRNRIQHRRLRRVSISSRYSFRRATAYSIHSYRRPQDQRHRQWR
jgi:hypothetical protein